MAFDQDIYSQKFGHARSIAQTNKVLRQTYMLLAVSMVPHSRRSLVWCGQRTLSDDAC